MTPRADILTHVAVRVIRSVGSVYSIWEGTDCRSLSFFWGGGVFRAGLISSVGGEWGTISSIAEWSEALDSSCFFAFHPRQWEHLHRDRGMVGGPPCYQSNTIRLPAPLKITSNTLYVMLLFPSSKPKTSVQKWQFVHMFYGGYVPWNLFMRLR